MKILLIAYDNGSYIPFPPLGLMYLQAALEKEGHECKIWHQDTYHNSDAFITTLLDAGTPFDIVGLGFVAGYYQYRKAQSIAKAVNASKYRDKFKFILGGHGPAAAPDFFQDKLGADTVFVGEALLSIVDYVNLVDGFIEIPGPPLMSCHKLVNPDDFPRPLYSNLPMAIYRLIRFPAAENTDFCFPILSGSGCKWKCSFCYRMDEGFRARSPESTIAEMEYLWRFDSINYFQFADELFMSSADRTVTFCEELIRAREEKCLPANFKFDCNARLNFAKKDVLAIMKRAGAHYLNYGIESMDPQVLKNINKGLTPDQITQGVENTLAAGLIPGLNFMWGNIGDSAASLELAANFIIKYNTGHELRTIRPVTPYPGSPLFDEAIKRGLCNDVEDFYENRHINSDLISCNFMDDIPTDEAHRLLYKANIRILRHHYEAKRMMVNAQAFDMYEGINTNFRGYRDI